MSKATLQRRKKAAALAAAQLAAAEGDHSGGDDDDVDTDSLYGAARSDNDDNEFFDDDELDDDGYSDESDVFEDDFEALEFHERARERALGIDNCMIEMKSTTLPVDSYPFPCYLSKLPELISEDSVFGKDVVQYIYCNNLMVLACHSLLSYRALCGQWDANTNGCLCLLVQSGPARGVRGAEPGA